LEKLTSYLAVKIGIIILILIYGCCAPSAGIKDYEAAESLATKKLGNDFVRSTNESSTYLLFYKNEEKRNQPHTSLSYFVYSLEKKEIAFEEKVLDAEVKWFDDKHIEIQIKPEVISGDDETTNYFINVLTKEKLKSIQSTKSAEQ
jgi:hypothetical protein